MVIIIALIGLTVVAVCLGPSIVALCEKFLGGTEEVLLAVACLAAMILLAWMIASWYMAQSWKQSAEESVRQSQERVQTLKKRKFDNQSQHQKAVGDIERQWRACEHQVLQKKDALLSLSQVDAAGNAATTAAEVMMRHRVFCWAVLWKYGV